MCCAGHNVRTTEGYQTAAVSNSALQNNLVHIWHSLSKVAKVHLPNFHATKVHKT